MRFRDAVFLLVLVAGLATASAAWSAGPPVVDQYYEQVPDASGGAGSGGGTGSGSGGGGAQELSPSIQSELESSVPSSTADVLQEVATSPALGAPTSSFGSSSRRPEENEAVPSTDSPFGDAVSAATDGGEAHILAIPIALVLITSAGAVLALRRRRHGTA